MPLWTGNEASLASPWVWLVRLEWGYQRCSVHIWVETKNWLCYKQFKSSYLEYHGGLTVERFCEWFYQLLHKIWTEEHHWYSPTWSYPSHTHLRLTGGKNGSQHSHSKSYYYKSEMQWYRKYFPELVIRDEICHLGEGPSLEMSPSSSSALTAFSSSEEHVEGHSIFLCTSSTQVTICRIPRSLGWLPISQVWGRRSLFLHQKVGGAPKVCLYQAIIRTSSEDSREAWNIFLCQGYVFIFKDCICTGNAMNWI